MATISLTAPLSDKGHAGAMIPVHLHHSDAYEPNHKKKCRDEATSQTAPHNADHTHHRTDHGNDDKEAIHIQFSDLMLNIRAIGLAKCMSGGFDDYGPVPYISPRSDKIVEFGR
ncbi:hypothetical protein [Achromobacter spanius]|uniref:Uncharacterized protein n=1 Tax=Achromobacter spanius TaxID=217203 RepID=A0AA42IU77_9BURK|nr:hypothetical protein [Achromobacter spanius]MDH0734785.1 hypothetical protein [Achromobacter spanius]